MDPILGTIQAFAFSFAPVDWELCWGQTMPISGNEALYSLLSTTFGGDGRTTFGLPDLRGRTIIGVGAATYSGQTLITSPVAWGQKGGAETVAINVNNLPAHAHQLVSGDGTGLTVKITTKVQSVDNGNESSDTGMGTNVLGTGGTMPPIYRESPSGNDSLGGVASVIAGSTTAWGVPQPAPLSTRNPYLGVNYCICTNGYYPTRP